MKRHTCMFLAVGQSVLTFLVHARFVLNWRGFIFVKCCSYVGLWPCNVCFQERVRGGKKVPDLDILFPPAHHEWLLSDAVDILPFLLLPLAGPEELSDEENEGKETPRHGKKFLISLQNRQAPAAADSVSCTVPGTVISDGSTVLKYILGPKEWSCP